MASDATCTKCDAGYYPTKKCDKKCTGLTWTDGTKDTCTTITAAKASTVDNTTGKILTCSDKAWGPNNAGDACEEKCKKAEKGEALTYNTTSKKCLCEAGKFLTAAYGANATCKACPKNAN